MGKKRKTLRRPCSDETRFQGIATLYCDHRLNRPERNKLAVTRPVFRGLRLRYGIEDAHDLLGSCSDETRFQGIATRILRIAFQTRLKSLAVTRPVFRGLRLYLDDPNLASDLHFSLQ